jgi:hypothetical protein
VTDDTEDVLAALTLSAGQDLVEQEFACRHRSGDELVLRLVSVEKINVRGASVENQDRPFLLLFRGPLETPLSQGMHNLGHENHPLDGIFLVQVAGKEGHTWYEAVFS